MTDRELLLELMDREVRDVTLRMTGIELVRVGADPPCGERKPGPLLSIEVEGNDSFTLYYSAEERLLQTIAERMKRHPVADLTEALEYDKEYFNVICGHVISALNREKRTSLRFGVPSYRAWEQGSGPQEDSLVLYYCSREGAASMQSR